MLPRGISGPKVLAFARQKQQLNYELAIFCQTLIQLGRVQSSWRGRYTKSQACCAVHKLPYPGLLGQFEAVCLIFKQCTLYEWYMLFQITYSQNSRSPPIGNPEVLNALPEAPYGNYRNYISLPHNLISIVGRLTTVNLNFKEFGHLGSFQ